MRYARPVYWASLPETYSGLHLVVNFATAPARSRVDKPGSHCYRINPGALA